MKQLTEIEIRKYINSYRGDPSELGKAKLAYYKELLAYKREEANVELRTLIKSKLRTDHVGGNFSQREVAKVLGMTDAKVKSIENKVIRLLKHPNKSKGLKKYLNQGE